MEKIKILIIILILILTSDSFSQGSANYNYVNPQYSAQTLGWYQTVSPTANTLNGLVNFSNLGYYYTFGDAGSLYRRNSITNSWTNRTLASTFSIKGMVSGVTGQYAVGSGGNVYRSVFNDLIWTSYIPVVNPSTKPTFNINSVLGGADVLYIVGDGGNFAYAYNVGNIYYEWYYPPTGTTQNLNSLSEEFAQASTGVIIAVGNHGTILKSFYPYTSWAIKSSGTTANLYCVVKTGNAGGQLAVAVGANGTILRSTDIGETWIQSASITSSDLRCVSYENSIGLACGTNGTILYDNYGPTLNRGVNWIQQSTPTTQTLNGITGIGNNEALAVGAGGIILRTTTGGTPLKLNLTAFIQGFYNSTSNKMIRDTATIYLRNSISPYSIADTAKSTLDSAGKGSFFFNKISIGSSYYIIVRHRNSIETWSAAGVLISPDSISYNFTGALSNAFGNNLIQIDNSPARFAIYSGDVNQDGTIDASDVSDADNDSYNSVSGYVRTDITGDDFVDADDVSIVDNNAFNSVSVVNP